MTKKEFATFAMALKTYFPKENLLSNQQSMELWFRELQDIDYQLAEVALRKYVQVNKWSPSISEIRQMASEVRHGELPDWGQAWENTIRAIRKYGSYHEKEALESLDQLTRSTVERLGFRELCVSTDYMSDRANFRMIYNQLSDRKKERQQVSLPLSDIISRLSSNCNSMIEEMKK